MDQQTLLFFLFVLMVPSDSEEVKNLTGVEGGNITLPDPVLEHGFLHLERKTLAGVHERKILIHEKSLKDRILWNNNTGHFTITGLQRSDSGSYTIDSKEGSGFTTSYKLSVYESLSIPAVKTESVSAESCTLLCSVNRSEETTLSWFSDEKIVNQSSSALSLLLTIDKEDYNSSYRCVAASPAENKTHSINVTTLCSHQKEKEKKNYLVLAVIISIVSVVLVVLFACIIKWRSFDKNKKTYTHTQVHEEPDVEYSTIHLVGNRNSQGGIFPASPAAVPDSLTTVYSKLEVHHMLPINTPNPVYEQTTAYIH